MRKCKHGMWKTKEYGIWNAMRQRCTNPNSQKWKHYGGRGIKVCDEWLKSFIPFYEHIGPKPSSEYSLDRINNDGNYEPGNVRWATIYEQNNNMRVKRDPKNGRYKSTTETITSLEISNR
jgi:hypothetical protein